MATISRKNSCGAKMRLRDSLGMVFLPALVVMLCLLPSPSLHADSSQEYIYLDGELLAVDAASSSCAYSLSPPSGASFTASGGPGTINVSCSVGCSWTATNTASWITVTGSGNGGGTVSYSVAANTGTARSHSMTIGGQPFTISQSSGCSSISISPASRSFGMGGGTGTISVTAGSGCGWTATSNVSWITVTSGGSGSGNGTVGYSVPPGGATPRSGTITVGTQPFTVSQRPTCQEYCSMESNDCSSQGMSMCGSSCEQEILSQYPGCWGAPSACMALYSSCVSACTSSVEYDCGAQYNYCLSTCK